MRSVLIRVGYNHMDIFFGGTRIDTDRHGFLLRASLQLVSKEKIIRGIRVNPCGI